MSKITEALKKAEEERVKKRQTGTEIRDIDNKLSARFVNYQPAEELVVFHDKDSYISEQYRIAKINIERLDPKNPPRSIVITSSIHREGKSVTAVNLAYILASDEDKKILLVDADLRKPNLAKLLGLNQEEYQGLSDMLDQFIPLQDLLLRLEENLYYLPAGRKKSLASNLLSRPQTKELFEYLRKKFHRVIIDAPPVLSFADAGILASFTDGCIMVIKASLTQRKVITNTISLLKQNRIKIIGAFLVSYRSHLPSYLAKYYYATNYNYK